MAFAQSARTMRPIEGAVATLGVSDRVAFLRKTYAHLGVALIAWALLTAAIFRYATETSFNFSKWALDGSRWNWFLVLGAFMLVQAGAQALAKSDTSRGVQYAGLGLGVIAEAVILQPLIWILFARFSRGDFGSTSP